MRPVLAIVLIAAAMGLSACSDKTLGTLLQWMQIGYSQEQWLEQYSTFGQQWDRVGLLFGFFDDLEGCEMIVNALKETQPKARYRCLTAN
jgi:hypothetical protein